MNRPTNENPRQPRSMLAIVTCLGVSAFLATPPALAAEDPTNAGSTSIGTVAGDSRWWGLWPTQFGGPNDIWSHYTVLSSTQTNHTYINAQRGGSIYFRSDNNGGVIDPSNNEVGLAYLTSGGHFVASGIIESKQMFYIDANSPSSLVTIYNRGTGPAIYGYVEQSGSGVTGQAANAGTGVSGTSFSGSGVYGASVSGKGVMAVSSSGYGLFGQSTSSDGVHGYSTSGYGVFGTGAGPAGVHGESTSAIGVDGVSGSGKGVQGMSNTGYGVYGVSTSNYGVFGQGFTTGGVRGVSGSGNAIEGSTNGPNWAGNFIGATKGAYSKGTTYAVYSDGPLYVNSSSTTKVGGSGTWTVTSDARVKKDVVDYAGGLAELEKIRPVRFKYNGLAGTETAGKEYVGVLAQELEPVAPYMVASTKKKLRDSDRDAVDLRQVDPNAFTYMLINAVKELARENRELVAQNRQVVAQSNDIRRLLCASRRGEPLCGAKTAMATATATAIKR